MDKLDTLLAAIRNMPVDPRLADIDEAVLAGTAKSDQSAISLRAVALVAMASLGAGILGAGNPAQPMRTAAMFPLGSPAALAPSTLLADAE